MARVCVDVASKEENALLFVPIYLLPIQNSATNVPRSERARTYLHRRHASSPPTSASVTISQQQ